MVKCVEEISPQLNLLRRSPNLKFLNSEMSKLLIGANKNVLRPMFETAPLPAWMYFAFGLIAE